jgi:hypothetical protein
MPRSSTSRASTRRAVWRCFFVAVRSSVSISSINGLIRSSFGATSTGVFRGSGIGELSAARTVRRCTRYRTASSRIDNSSMISSDRLE